MFLLPSKVAPSRKARAIFTGVRRIMKPDDTLYLPPWTASTLLERAPVVEAIPDDLDLLHTDVVQLEIDTRNQIRMLESILALNWNQPFDATFMKGLNLQCQPI